VKRLNAQRSSSLLLYPPTARRLADPAPVAQTFFVDAVAQSYSRLDAIITVVDAKHALAHLDEQKPEGVENESVEQARAHPFLSACVYVYACVLGHETERRRCDL
jgi:hypothetical protein